MFKSFTDGFSGWIVGKTGADEVRSREERVDAVKDGSAANPEASGAEQSSGAAALDKDNCANDGARPADGGGAPADGELATSTAGKSSFADASVKLDELTDVAKQWGSYLLSVGKAATKTVAHTALEIKKTVGEKTILGDFVKEQEKFVSEKRERQQRSEAAVPPWVGYNEEETMKQQILSLSLDKRNFLRNPPVGVQFHFEYDTCYPVALAMLAEDKSLEKMRFDLVPKQVSEHDFWRNYFYRVSLIKQSAQLTSMAKQSSAKWTSGASMQSYDNASSSAITTTSAAEQKAQVRVSPGTTGDGKGVSEVEARPEPSEVPASQSLPQDEFISDDYQGVVNDDDLRKEMEALRVKEAKPKEPTPSEETPEWEKELQKELNEYEVVGGTGGSTDDLDVDDDELEKEILEQIADSKS